MTNARSRRSRLMPAAIWLAVAAGLLLVVGANAHLLYAAVTSQPACVLHLRSGDGGADHGRFIAARSACTPQRQGSSEQRGTS